MTSPTTITQTENVILFDGVCNLCNGAVNFILDRDPGERFKFASLQSGYGQQYLENNDLPLDSFESMVLLKHGRSYRKSTAALEIARQMGGLWPLLYAFIVIPSFLRDPLYNLVANNRYKWFGKRDQCRVPTPELKSRFLD